MPGNSDPHRRIAIKADELKREDWQRMFDFHLHYREQA